MRSLQKKFKLDIAAMICLLYSILPPSCCCNGDDGRNIIFREPIPNMAMKNHVIRSEEVPTEGSCRVMCYMEPNCVSINVGPLKGGRHKCELNNATEENHLTFLLEKKTGYTYLAIENPCSSSPCLNNGTCQAGFTSKGFCCVCRDGFTGTICYQDVDECSSGSHVCDVNANCTNTVGSHNCTCREGFTGNGDTCSDVDECTNGSHDCHVDANCTNTVGSHNCTCKEGFFGDGRSCSAHLRNCAEIYKYGKTRNGVQSIKPDNLPAFDVYCDQSTIGGGWTVFQRRLDGSVDFYRYWNDYKQGFGNLSGEFWLGLDKMHRLSSNNTNIMKLRVDLEDFEGNTSYAEYSLFGVMSETYKYMLDLGSYSGTAGDSLTYHHGQPFSTQDQDNDHLGDGNCASKFHGAWWYKKCHRSNLNGLYHRGYHSSFADGVNWYHWMGYNYSMMRTEMKIRPNWDF